ncbi:MAG: ATP synthase gamma chain, sodium ion specific [bacterium ADurb.Bin212]|nr:MAG: ATP synthase gamma chain, sodium ion specific [bacterium ADurb.Bin212]
MASINEIKEKMGVVKSVGGFANAMQQIAAMRMMALRDKVLSSKRFVDEANQMLAELNLYKELFYQKELENKKDGQKKSETAPADDKPLKKAIVVVSSNQGLCGKFNAEIFRKVESEILANNLDADFFLIGRKGQEHYLNNKKFHFKFYPYELVDTFEASDLLRLVEMFPYYDRIMLVYTRYINTVNRDVVNTILVVPPAKFNETPDPKEKIKFLFEPTLEELIKDIEAKLRAATFQQQILDSRLAQFSAQMVGMQAATENAKTLLSDLTQDYNKQRRKIIDKKISEVFAGSALW